MSELADIDDAAAWFLESKAPVLVPHYHALCLSQSAFDSYLVAQIKAKSASHKHDTGPGKYTNQVAEGHSRALEDLEFDLITTGGSQTSTDQVSSEREALDYSKTVSPEQGNIDNRMLTENNDVAYRSTLNPLVDLFAEAEEVVSGPRLRELLDAAWSYDSLATLKIIFNIRSIHLGKSSRHVFYRCAGWLAQNHPLTLVANLKWLSRPVIEKKVSKKSKGGGDEMVIVEVKDIDESNPAHYDVRNGVAHGYWKDLLNILALSVNCALSPLVNPRDVLNVDRRKDKTVSEVDKETAKDKRRTTRDARHERATRMLVEDPTYCALHLTVARLFARQLQTDLELLKKLPDDTAKANSSLSLCAKWAPSPGGFHDKHTFVVSSIAEILYPPSRFSSAGAGGEPTDRETYLRRAREAYRCDVSKLRKRLDVVERNIAAGAFDRIDYERVPSLAMSAYAPLFAAKDADRFEEYVSAVASGAAGISGATLLPSTLVRTARQQGGQQDKNLVAFKNAKAMIKARQSVMQAKVVDGQWRTLVQRIRDSGALESSIAVCDVSGSMTSPVFPDGTSPIDSAVGLSLLVAEVARPPFGGAFITFSQSPQVQHIDLDKTFHEKIKAMIAADWGGNTDFVAVFEQLLLPMATKRRLANADMVKRVFVFSDMQFDAADRSNGGYGRSSNRWAGSYERIASKYKAAGYDMPELVFWNLAGGRAGYSDSSAAGDPIAPKPTTASQAGTAMVSGYSQGLLKVFLDGGSFGDRLEEEEATMEEDNDEDVVVVQTATANRAFNPLSLVMKAIGHKAYGMLRVVD